MAESSQLPQTQKALMQHVYAEPLKVETVPTPQPTPGSAIVRIEAANVISYAKNIYNGVRNYQYPTPLIPGTSALGRVAAVGPDSVFLKLGQLVLIDCTIRGRDDPSAIFLSGIVEGGTEGSKKLMAGEWRNSSYAEYMKVPLENCHVLDEKRLCGSPNDGGLGYSMEQLLWISAAMVPYGGLKSINLQPGETVIVAPATGAFGGAAVLVALGMGARVIAMGRNQEALARLDGLGDRVRTVQMTGNIQEEMAELKKNGPVDVFFDISPPQAKNSTHIKSAIFSLKEEGRVSLMGGLLEDVPIPHRFVMRFSITIKGKWMFYRSDVVALIKMVEMGLLSFDHVKVIGSFPLEKWEEAFEVAYNKAGLGEIALLKP